MPDEEKSRVLTIWGKFYGTDPIVDREFIHKGIMVREIIGELANELGTYKLLWCRIPIDLIIDGWKNPFFHVDFSPKSDVMYSCNTTNGRNSPRQGDASFRRILETLNTWKE